VQIIAKKLSKFIKKFTHVDDLMIHNIVKISCPNSTLFVRYKNNKFQAGKVSTGLLEVCYFYISQMNSSLDKIFYKVVYHHIIYMCNFFDEFR